MPEVGKIEDACKCGVLFRTRVSLALSLRLVCLREDHAEVHLVLFFSSVLRVGPLADSVCSRLSKAGMCITSSFTKAGLG